MTAGVGKMELVQMPEGSTYINESTQSRGDDECLPNVPLNAFFAPCRWIEVSTDGRLGNKLVTWLKKKRGGAAPTLESECMFLFFLLAIDHIDEAC